MFQDRVEHLEKRVQEGAAELARRATQLQLSREVGRLAASILDLDELLRQVVRLVQARCGYRFVGVWLWSDRRDGVVLRASAGWDARPTGPDARLTLDEAGLVGAVCQTGLPRLAGDARPTSLDAPPPGVRSELVLPLHVGETVVGALDIQAAQANAFDDEDITAMQIVADQLAAALRNARLFEAERQQRDLADTLREAVATLATLDVNVVLDGLLEQVGRVVPHDRANVMLIEGDHACTVRQRGYDEEPAASVCLSLDKTFTLRHMIETCQPIVIPDTQADPNWDGCVGMNWGRSYAAAPICARGRVLGFLNVHSAAPGFFGADHAGRLRAFADGAAIALENARLYQDAQREKQYFKSMVQTSPVAIITYDLEGNVVSWNPAAEKLFGYTQAETIGRNIDEFVAKAGDLRAEALAYTQQAMEGVPIHSVTRRYRRDGSLVDVEMFSASVSVESERVGALVIYHDVTELQRARQEAEAANRAKSAFLAMMSHEIRTPLNAIIGMAGLLLGTPLTPEQRDFAETIRTSGDALLTIINDILDFSKIEAGRMDLESRPFDLRGCLESALDLVAAGAAEKGLELVCIVEPHVPGTLVGDVNRLRQVLVNLLSNAVKFTEHGEIVLRAALRAADPKYPHSAPLLHFSVRDTGMGIPPDRQAGLFQSFSQVDTSISRHYGGTGLGLAISKRLVGMMNGTIWVESDGVPGQGSTFHFSLPATPAPDARPIYDTAPGELPTLAGRRLLIVDDNQASRESLALQVQAWGMVPVAAASGQEALALIRQGDLYDAALLDVSLPDLDGPALAVEIRRIESTQRQPPGLPVVLLAPLGWREADAAPEHVLAKPVKTTSLYNSLVHVITGRAGPEPQRSQEEDAVGPVLDASMGKRWPLRILIAEDHPTNQKLALLLLERLGYRADVAANGLEARAALVRQPYDVVLMDVQMPDMDGLEATRAIRRELPAERQPRIIALTASAAREDREMCLAAGMDDYLDKPVRPAALLGALKRAIGTAPPVEPLAGEPPAPPAALPPDAVLDPEALENLRRMLGEGFAATLPELVGTFFESTPRLLGELRQGLAQGDADRVRLAAHALKSSSATFGATAFSNLCRRVEDQGHAGDLEGAAELAAQIEAEYVRVHAALETVLASLGKDKGD